MKNLEIQPLEQTLIQEGGGLEVYCSIVTIPYRSDRAKEFELYMEFFQIQDREFCTIRTRRLNPGYFSLKRFQGLL
jgi:hypothetical protein